MYSTTHTCETLPSSESPHFSLTITFRRAAAHGTALLRTSTQLTLSNSTRSRREMLPLQNSFSQARNNQRWITRAPKPHTRQQPDQPYYCSNPTWFPSSKSRLHSTSNVTKTINSQWLHQKLKKFKKPLNSLLSCSSWPRRIRSCTHYSCAAGMRRRPSKEKKRNWSSSSAAKPAQGRKEKPQRKQTAAEWLLHIQ